MSNQPPASSPYNRRTSGSLWSDLQNVLLHPVAFFRQLPARDGRAWLWAGCLILLVIGVSAVRQSTPQSADVAFSDQLVTGLLAAGQLVIGWCGLTLTLSLISMLHGRAPALALNWRIAIWSSVPFGLLALAQIGYIALGESIAGSGIAPVVPDIPGYDDLQPVLKILLQSAASQITLFGLWQMALLAVAGHYCLRGRWWSVLLTLLMWAGLALWLPGVVQIMTNPPPALDDVPELAFAAGLLQAIEHTAGWLL